MQFLQQFGFPIFLPIFIIVGCLLARNRYKENSSREKTVEDFFERERRANSTRKQDVSHLDYIALDLNALPMGKIQDEVLMDCERTLTDLSQKQILNLSHMSNTDLKLEYGAANLDFLSQCDENYHILSQTLLNYGMRASELNHIQEAIAILEYASSLHIDSSKIYLLLARLYSEAGTPEKISDIEASLNAMDESFRSYVLNHLESCHIDG